MWKLPFLHCGSNNWETVRWVHAARSLASTKLYFYISNVLRDCHRGVPRGNKNVVKITIFGLTHWLKHRITRKLLKIHTAVHTARALASIELSFHPWNILRDSRRGVSRGNKNVGCGTWKRWLFALAVRITGKLLKIDGYMLRGVWQTLNCLFIYGTFCVIATGASPGQTKKWRPGYVKMTIFLQ